MAPQQIKTELRVAVEGCGHGTLNSIYASIEKSCIVKGWDTVDVLIIGGDFQAVRNKHDLNVTAMPAKFRQLGDFHEYYSGVKKAPCLTIFVGGNHEASNHLFELYYGGWVAHNIYYMGAANVLQVGPLRIAGLSGIWKGYDYKKTHFERLPYNKPECVSIFHTRELDARKLLSIQTQVDVGLSHDWPRGIEWNGNHEWLFRNKRGFKEDAEKGHLGSAAVKECLDRLRPSQWFAAHLHVKYSAVVEHPANESAKLPKPAQRSSISDKSPKDERQKAEAHITRSPVSEKSATSSVAAWQSFSRDVASAEASENERQKAEAHITRSPVSEKSATSSVAAWQSFSRDVASAEASENERILQEQKVRQAKEQQAGARPVQKVVYDETHKEVAVTGNSGRSLKSVNKSSTAAITKSPSPAPSISKSSSSKSVASSPQASITANTSRTLKAVTNSTRGDRGRLTFQTHSNNQRGRLTFGGSVRGSASPPNNQRGSSSGERAAQVNAWQNFGRTVARSESEESERIARAHEERRAEEARTGVRAVQKVVYDETHKVVGVSGNSDRALKSVTRSVPAKAEVSKYDGCIESKTKRLRSESPNPPKTTVALPHNAQKLAPATIIKNSDEIVMSMSDSSSEDGKVFHPKIQTIEPVIPTKALPFINAGSDSANKAEPGQKTFSDESDDGGIKLANPMSLVQQATAILKKVEEDEESIPEDIRAQLAQISSSFAPQAGQQNESTPLPAPAAIHNTTTNFLALDKCDPGRDFLQLMEIEALTNDDKATSSVRPYKLNYDPEWLAITRVFAPELQLGGTEHDVAPPHKGDAYYRERIVQEEQWVQKHVVQAGRLEVPENFTLTAPICQPNVHVPEEASPREYTNPQTSQFCDLVGIENKFDFDEQNRDVRMDSGPLAYTPRPKIRGRGRANKTPDNQFRGRGGFGRGGGGRGGGGRGGGGGGGGGGYRGGRGRGGRGRGGA